MAAPVCPSCGSNNVSPDQSPGGAGRNVCQCGYRAAVREFYPQHGEIRMTHRQGEDGQSTKIKVTLFVDPSRLKTSTPPAPIRQYKDE